MGTNLVTSMHPILKGFAQLGQMLGGFAGLIVLAAGIAAAVSKRTRKRIYDAQTGISSIRELTWSHFELLVGEVYRQQGYAVIETGGGGADGGVDLKLKSERETVLVQCKQWKAYKVGVKPIRELYGVLMAGRADRAIFVTSGVYTREAQEFADGKPVQLIDGVRLCEMIEPVWQRQAIMPGVRIGSEEAGCRVERAASVNIPSSTKEVGAPGSPACPVCADVMVLRTAKRGMRIGSQFWGCSTYPQCRGTRPLAHIVA